MADMPTVVADIMTTEVVTLNEEQNLQDLKEGMKRFGFRHLPVVDGKRLVGLITERDILGAALSDRMPAHDAAQSNVDAQLFVAKLMHRDISTVRADTPIVDAARTMRDHKFGCLPVIDGESNLVGIVTESDFLDLAIQVLSD